jgi:hypothetical protein
MQLVFRTRIQTEIERNAYDRNVREQMSCLEKFYGPAKRKAKYEEMKGGAALRALIELGYLTVTIEDAPGDLTISIEPCIRRNEIHGRKNNHLRK